MIDTNELLATLPKNMQRNFNAATMAEITSALTDKDERERFKENFISYSSVLLDGKYSVQQYVDAVKYVSYKHFGLTNLDAFKRTFPLKMARYKREGKNIEKINSFVSGYNKTKLVTSIFKQSAVPLYILNQDAAQEAINAQLRILRTSSNDLAVVKAADSLLSHLAPPVETQVAVRLDTGDNSLLEDFRNETRDLAKLQQNLIKQGHYTAAQIAEMRIVGEAEYVDVP